MTYNHTARSTGDGRYDLLEGDERIGYLSKDWYRERGKERHDGWIFRFFENRICRWGKAHTFKEARQRVDEALKEIEHGTKRTDRE